jgi:hypothetical protein
MVVCPACRKSVSLKAAVTASARSAGRAGARREPPNVRETAPRQETLVWIVHSPDGRPAANLAKADLDRRVAAGEFDARAQIKRQDWSETKSIAEVYQGLAVACADKLAEAAGKEGGVASSLSHPASPWASSPELTTVAAQPPKPPRPPDRLRGAKIFLLVGALLCGFIAFYGALGDTSVQPVLPRRLLFLLFAAYWLGAWLLAAALFGWQVESAEGEPRGPHRVLGPLRTRWLLAVVGVAVMSIIIWFVA